MQIISEKHCVIGEGPIWNEKEKVFPIRTTVNFRLKNILKFMQKFLQAALLPGTIWKC